MNAVGRVLGVLCGVALVWCLVGFCDRDVERVPQVVKGEGALAVAFGDARETISQALVHKADSYFHGGIDMECDHLADHGNADHDDDHDHEDCHDEHDYDEAAHCSFEPWRWINSHVRAPEVHRHLGGSDAVEMMPWFWASVKADPHNIEAWTTTWYIANNMMKNKGLALRVVAEGLEKNPDDPELLICRGRTFYDHGRGEFAAAREAFSAAVESAAKIISHEDAVSDRIVQARDFAQAYLDEIAKRGMEVRNSSGR